MSEDSTETKTRKSVYVDRIEDGLAVLVEDEEDLVEREVAASLLPKGTKEGDWLRLRDAGRDLADALEQDEGGTPFVRDRAATRAAKRRVQALMDELS